MNKLSRKERTERAEQKKEAIRKEIYKVMVTCSELENLDPVITINKAIDIMIKKNPQEAHFVRTICFEIRQDPNKFTDTMIQKYGVELKKGDTNAPNQETTA